MPREAVGDAPDGVDGGTVFGPVAARLPTLFRAAGARRLGVDARGLAALRVALGLLVLADLVVRSQDLLAHYADGGALPRTVLREAYPGLSSFAWAHGLAGAAWLQGLLFVIAGGVAVALVLGYRTRLAGALSFLLLVSLQARNPVLLNAGDSLLRRLLLWGVLLPLGARWSVDAVHRSSASTAGSNRVVSLASAGLLAQVLVVYLVNAVLKLRGDTWLGGEGVRTVYALDHLTVGLGDALAGQPALLEVLGPAWLGLLVASPLLLLLVGWQRAAMVGALVGGHLGMLLTLRLGLFPLVSVAALLPFLPPRVWDAAAARLPPWFGRTAMGWRARFATWLPRGPRPPSGASVRRTGHATATVVAALLLTFILVWNAMGLGYIAAPDGVGAVADPTERRWDMFAPDPRANDGWFVAPATTVDGRTVDAWNGGSASFERPQEFATTFPSHRWFVYLLALPRPGTAPLRTAFAEYLCRRWDDRHSSSLERVTVYYVEERVRLDAPEERVRVDLGSYACPAG